MSQDKKLNHPTDNKSTKAHEDTPSAEDWTKPEVVDLDIRETYQMSNA